MSKYAAIAIAAFASLAGIQSASAQCNTCSPRTNSATITLDRVSHSGIVTAQVIVGAHSNGTALATMPQQNFMDLYATQLYGVHGRFAQINALRGVR